MPRNRTDFRLEFKTAKAGKTGEVMIYSAIASTNFWGDEITSRDFDKALRELGDVEEITVRINSPGGAVSEAVAIRTALMKHSAKKTVDIEGSCCSAATIIACMPGVRVRMAKGSDYMIHRCSWAVRGRAQDMLAAYHSMINTDNDIADIYAEKTGKTREECLAMMDRTTWLNVDQAIADGFADEKIEAAEDGAPIAACAIEEDVYKTMQALYDNVPELPVIQSAGGETENERANPVSNEKTAVAAGNSSENTGETPKEGGTTMEVRTATAEEIQAENPEAARAIAEAAANAALERERDRVARIRKVTRRGQEAMRDKAIEEGTSVEAYLEALIAEEDRTRQAYLHSRADELKPAEQIGAGDPSDTDQKDDRSGEDKLAREIAELAAGMSVNTQEMA